MALARWQATIVDDTGNRLPGALIEVRREAVGAALATLYSDRDGATPIGNPFAADADGFAAFHVAGGAYKITATSGAFSRVWRYVGVGTAAEIDSDGIVFKNTDDDLADIRNFALSGFIDFTEIPDASPEEPEAPPVNGLRVYAKDVGGVTRLHTLDSAGTETELGAGGSVDPDSLFNSVTVGTADSGNVLEEYALSDEGNYDGIVHTLSDDYNRLIRISRVSSSDGNHVPMDIALASRGTLDTPLPMQVGDRSWAIAAAGRAADDTWQRLGYQWFEVKSAPSGNIIPGMHVLRVTKPDDYFPRTITSSDWTDGIRHSAHSGFDGIIDQTDAATIAWNVAEAQVAEVTLGGNRTLEPSGMVDGFEYDLFVSADASARILNFSSAGSREWYLRGNDGIFYDQNSPLALPANGFAHIKISSGVGGTVYSGTVNFIVGHPQRAVVPSEQFTCLTTNRAGSNNNSAQAVFASTEDTLTVAASTSYFFEAVYSFTRAAGTTAHRTNVLFGGTATFTSIGYHILASTTEDALGGGIPYAIGRHANVATATDIFGGDSNDAAEAITVKLSGIMRINAGGTIIPQIQYSAAPGGAPTFLAGSYFRAWPVGDNNVVAVGDFA